jgi:hypothetical protein
VGKYGKWLKLIGVGLWVYIVLQLDLAGIGEVLQVMNLKWFLLAFIFLAGMFLFKALRWRTVLLLQGVHYGLIKTVGISFVSSFFGLMIPGKMGDIIKVSYVKRSGLSVVRGLVSVLLDRVYDLLVLLLFSVFGLVYFSGMFAAAVRDIGIMLLVLALAAVFLVAQRERILSVVNKLLKFALNASSYETISQEWSSFKEEFTAISKKTVIPMSAFSVLTYLCMFCQFFALACGLGLVAPFLYLGLSLSLATLVSLLPISIGGLGTREAVFILMLGKIAISPESAVLLSFIDLVVFAVLLPGIFTLPFWLTKWHEDGPLAS